MSRLPAAAAVALSVLVACAERADHDVEHDSAAAAGGATAAAHAAGSHAAPGEGGQPLLTIMQALGTEMNALTYALMTDDTAGVGSHASAIAEHAPIAADDLERIHGILGARMARFEAVDESVHVASVRLHEAAREGRTDAALQRLGEVQRGCVSCHVQFRAELRTNR